MTKVRKINKSATYIDFLTCQTSSVSESGSGLNVVSKGQIVGGAHVEGVRRQSHIAEAVLSGRCYLYVIFKTGVIFMLSSRSVLSLPIFETGILIVMLTKLAPDS